MADSPNNSAPRLRSWQSIIFSSIWITYFAFYLCRLNMPIAKTRLCEVFSWDASQFGMILSALTLMYAIGQFVNGQLADRFGAKLIISIGILGSVVMNFMVFGVTALASQKSISSNFVLWSIIVFWGLNGFFQSMGWPSMVRIMTHWFPLKGRGRMMGFLGTCYQFGAAFSWLLAFYLIKHYGDKMGCDWRTVFWVPSLIFAIIGIIFYCSIRNYPEDVGLPPVESSDGIVEVNPSGNSQSIFKNIGKTLSNPYLWIVAGTFFLLDVNRYGFVNWLPAFLDEKGSSITAGTFTLGEVTKRCIHPLAGSVGAVVAGWATDKFFKGRRAPVIAFLLLLLGLLSMLFPYINREDTALMIFIIAAIGFCTYGPHILMVGHAAQDFGKKSGSAGAAGFIDAMGYIGASLAGWGAGEMIKRYGYKVNFITFGWAAILGALLICIIWKAGPKTHTAN